MHARRRMTRSPKPIGAHSRIKLRCAIQSCVESIEGRILLAGIPVVSGSQFIDSSSGGGQKLVFAFSDNVAPSLSTHSLLLVNLDSGQRIGAAQLALNYNPISHLAIFTFPGLASGVLPDGNYLSILNGKTIQAGGLPLDGNKDGVGGDDAIFSFAFLRGDLNHDRKVDASDVNSVTAGIGGAGVGPQDGDFNGDGQVNFADLVAVAQHYGQSVTRLADGDANLDGKVDFSDLVVVAQHYGATGVGDLNGDGHVDQADLQIVNQAVGHQLAAPPSLVARLPYDSGISAGDGITNNITVDGLINAGAAIGSFKVGIDGMPAANFGDATGDLDSSGGFSFSRARLEQLLGGALSDGAHVLHLQAFGAGNVLLASRDVALTLDTVAPAAPTFDLASGYTIAPGTTTFKAPFLSGNAEPGATISLGTISTTADASGAFSLSALLSVGANSVSLTATDAAGNTSASSTEMITRLAITTSNQVALDWNSATLAAITLDGSQPPVASRSLAMVSSAMYDAVNSVHGASSFLYVHIPAPLGSSDIAAVAQAAHDVLVYLYPAQQGTFDAQLAASLSAVANGSAKSNGISVGQQVAAAIIAQRANDGSTDYVDYTPGSGPGVWQPTYPMYASALLPNWATLQPFLMNSDGQFRPPGPPSLDSAQWVADYNQIMSLGSASSTTRTADQTQIARFWADGQGTVTPPGHWNLIAMQLLEAQGNVNLFDTLKLLAQLNVTMGDAAIVSWDAKYSDNFWRPITAIQAGGGNAALTADPNWIPLLNTPNFPEYVSGHSTFSGAAAGILSSFFGSNTPFSTTSPSPGVSGVVRNYANFNAAASEAGMSRIYGGIHYYTSNLDGLAAGKALADYVLAHFDDSNDTIAPKVVFDNASNATVKQNFALSGLVTDNLSGVKTLTGQLDDGAPFDVAIDANGHFSILTTLATDGGSDGPHVLHLTAIDYANNTSVDYDYHFTLDTAVPTITLTSPAGSQPIALTPTTKLTGSASGTGSPLVSLSYQFDSATVMPLAFSAADGSFSQLPDLSKLAAGNHTLKITATDAAGNSITSTINVALAAPIALTLSHFTPTQSAGDVGTTYRPEIFFSRAINTATLSSANFFATDTTGAKLPATIVPSNDGTYAWLFFTNAMPGASAITITVDGLSIKAADNTLLDAAGNGTAGSKLTYSFTTVSTTAIPNTSLSGTVADPGPDLKPSTPDDSAIGPDGIPMTADDVYKLPIAGVTVTIAGTTLSAVTDAQGHFSFPSVPSGDIKLITTGNTATNAPAGFYFPEMVMDLNILPGVANTVMAAMVRSGTGNMQSGAALSTAPGVYLPRLQTSLLQNVSSSTGAHIAVSAANAPDLTNQQRSHLTLDVPAGSIIGTNGQPMSSAQIGVSTVDPALVMDMLPAGVMQHTFDITVQAPGVATFSTPVAMTFPNVFNAEPGSKLNFLSFDHTTGRLVIEGTATVSADGLSVTTDPGTGVTHPGWHGLTPAGSPRDVNVGPGNSNGSGGTGGSGGGGGGGGGGSGPGDAPVDGDKNGDGKPDNTEPPPDDNPPDNDDQTYEVGMSIVVKIPKESLFLEPFFNLDLPDPLPNFDYSLKFAYPDQDLTWSFNVGAIDFTVSKFVSYALPDNAQYELFNVKGALSGTASIGADITARFDSLLNSVRFTTLLGFDASAQLSASVSGGIVDWLPAKAKEFVSRPRTYTIPIPKLAGIRIPPETINLPFTIPDFLKNQSFKLGAEAGANFGASIEIDPVIYIKNITPAQPALPVAGSNAPLPAPPPVDEPSSGYSTSSGFGSDTRAYYRYLVGNANIAGVSDPNGHFSVFLPPNQDYTLVVYRPSTNAWEITSGTTGPSGSPSSVKNTLTQIGGKDTDGDGIPDIGEFVLGTSSTSADTDHDGISDSAEIAQGSDPLGGRTIPTGILTSLAVQGTAKAVAVVGATDGTSGATALVATGNYGLAVVDASNPASPKVLSQLDLPGDATDVDYDPNLKIAAVAENSGGLVLVDLSDLRAPVIIKTINVPASNVRIKDGVAFAVDGNVLQSFDLLTGDLLGTLTPGAATLTGLAREGAVLYTMDTADVLRAIDISTSVMAALGSLQLQQGGGKLFVGNGIAYVSDVPASFANPNQAGFTTVNVANPAAMAILGNPSTAAIAGLSIKSNGSGLGVSIGSLVGFGSVVDVENVSNPANTNQFVTRYTLPAPGFDLTLAGGIAYVADGSAGLQIVNYTALDNQGISPTVSIDTTALDTDPGTPGIQAVEGSTIAIKANVSDDVQIRSVELLVNGKVVQNALSFPFNLSTTLPPLSAGASSVTVAIRATDTGGNVTTSAPVVLNLVRDTTPPHILGVNPSEGTTRGQGLRPVVISFSKGMDTATLIAGNFTLSDGTSTYTPANVQVRNNGATLQLTYASLPVGDYTLTANSANLKDFAGNALGTTDFVTHFKIAAVTAIFTNPAGGFWDDPNNWDTHQVPGLDDDVALAAGAGSIITIRGAAVVRSIIADSPINIASGGYLAASGGLIANQPFTIVQGGFIRNTPITEQAGVTSHLFGGSFDHVTLNGDYLVGHNALLQVTNGITINGNVTLGDGFGYGVIQCVGSQTIGGTGSISFANGIYNTIMGVNSGDVVTIGPNITVRGASGVVGFNPSLGGGSPNTSVINQGTIQADVAGGGISFGGVNSQNQGTLKAINGATLSLGTFTNNGIVTVDPISAMAISGTVSGGTINVQAGGKITGGTVSGVTLTGDATLGRNTILTIQNGLTLNGTITLGDSFGYGVLRFAGTQTLGGNGSVIFGTFGQFNTLFGGNSGDVVTIGPDITVRGMNGTVGFNPSLGGGASDTSIINQGTIQADTAGGTITFTGVNSQNLGTIKTIGGALTLGNVANSGNILIDSTGVVNVTGTVTGGTITAQSGARLGGGTLSGVTISGDLTIARSTFVDIHNGLTLNGSITLGDNTGYGVLRFAGNQTLGGSGSIIFGSSSVLNTMMGANSGDVLTIGSGITVKGKSGALGFNPSLGGGASDTSVINQGTIQIADGGSITDAGLLTNQGTVTVDSTSTLAMGGTLSGGIITTQAGARIGSMTLDNVTINGDFAVFSANVSVTHGLTLNGAATLGSGGGIYGYLRFLGSQTLGGSGSVLFGNSSALNTLSASNAGDVLTIGPNMTVHGNRGTLGYNPNLGGATNVSVINLGTISADVAGGRIEVYGIAGQNQGTLAAANGGDLSVTGQLANSGAINIDSTSALGGGNGIISGGTITTQAGALLTSIKLDAVTITGDARIAGNTTVTATGGINLGGTITIGDASGYGAFRFVGSQSIGGNGALAFGSTSSLNTLGAMDAGSILTIGQNITVRGQHGSLGYNPSLGGASNVSVVNLGTIQWSSGTSIVDPGTLTNNGTLTVDSTGTLALGGTVAGGTITTQPGAHLTTTTLDGVTINGDFTVSGGNISSLDGLTINGAATLGDASGFGYIHFLGSQTLGGGGSVVFGTSSPLNSLWSSVADSTLTIGQNFTVHGGQGVIGSNPSLGGATNIALVNLGTVRADADGRSITINGVVSNSGTMAATTGLLTVNGNFTNSGLLRPGGPGAAGATIITGSFTQTPSGTIEIEIAGTTPGTQYGRLGVTGAASLAGTVAVQLLNSFVPTAGTVFTFLTYGSHTGTFDTILDVDNQDAIGFAPTYNATSAVLTTGAPAPVPASAPETLVSATADLFAPKPPEVSASLFSRRAIRRHHLLRG